MKIICYVVVTILCGYGKSFPPDLIYLPKDSIKINENLSSNDLLSNDILEIGRDIWFEYRSLISNVFNHSENLVPKKDPESPPRIILHLKK